LATRDSSISANDVVKFALGNNINPDLMTSSSVEELTGNYPGWAASSTQAYSRGTALKELSGLIQNGQYIMIRVFVNSGTGNLEQNGIEHWVVVSAVCDGGVYLYNPYDNNLQFYSEDDFINNWFKPIQILQGEEEMLVEIPLMVIISPPPAPEPVFDNRQ